MNDLWRLEPNKQHAESTSDVSTLLPLRMTTHTRGRAGRYQEFECHHRVHRGEANQTRQRRDLVWLPCR